MVLKVAVVFIAGGLTGSGIVALTRSGAESQAAAETVRAAPLSDATASTAAPATWVEVSQPADQHGYVQARFAVQRPFAALHPGRR
jgi:hypothetical protein